MCTQTNIHTIPQCRMGMWLSTRPIQYHDVYTLTHWIQQTVARNIKLRQWNEWRTHGSQQSDIPFVKEVQADGIFFICANSLCIHIYMNLYCDSLYFLLYRKWIHIYIHIYISLSVCFEVIYFQVSFQYANENNCIFLTWSTNSSNEN